MNEFEDTHALLDAFEAVYERADTHGEPEDSFGSIADLWNSYLQAAGHEVDLDEADICKLFILMKIARSAEGVYDEDNPTDVAGYAENWSRVAGEDEEDENDGPFDFETADLTVDSTATHTVELEGIEVEVGPVTSDGIEDAYESLYPPTETSVGYQPSSNHLSDGVIRGMIARRPCDVAFERMDVDDHEVRFHFQTDRQKHVRDAMKRDSAEETADRVATMLDQIVELQR